MDEPPLLVRALARKARDSEFKSQFTIIFFPFSSTTNVDIDVHIDDKY